MNRSECWGAFGGIAFYVDAFGAFCIDALHGDAFCRV